MTHDPLTWDNLFGADPNYVNMPSDYEQGQRDMLAKCIAAVDGMVIDTVGNSAATVDQALAAMRALQEKP